jgi:hypothetical protein
MILFSISSAACFGLPQRRIRVIGVASRLHPFVKPAMAAGLGKIECRRSFGQQGTAEAGDDRRHSRPARGIRREDQMQQPDANRRQRLTGGVRAIEQIPNRQQRKLGARRRHQRPPPAAPSIQCRGLAGEQGYRAAACEHDSRVRQAVHDNGGILSADH